MYNFVAIKNKITSQNAHALNPKTQLIKRAF